jgi:hypothetical protein
MAIKFNPHPVKTASFPSAAVVSMLVMAFVLFIISASISPINNTIAR